MRPEYRKSTRRSVRHGARIVGADGSALGPCVMIDISGTGARLKTDASEVLPDEFILLLSHDGRLHRRCAVAWRSAKTVGVRFLTGRHDDRK
jgi:hypothetical protein